MKRFLIVLINFSFISQALAENKSPMMATAILKSTQAPSDYEVYRCSSNTITQMPTQKADAFMATITCEAKCLDRESAILQFSKEFVPEHFNLSAGDGSSPEKILWRSLGYTLSTWGNSECLNQAEKYCQTKENIQSFKMSEIRSGTWSFSGDLNCKAKKTVISPYDKSQKLAGHKVDKINLNDFFSPPMTKKINQMQSILPRNLNAEEAKKLVIYQDEKNHSCSHKINIKSCFGDCVYLEDGQKEWTETLSTTEFYGDLNFSICADQFISKIKNSKWSDDVNTALCKKLAWEVIRLSNAPGTSCAAYRVEVDCSQL